MHEIVTLQFGQQANHVGAHFWNTQESYFTYGAEEQSPVDHDIHFRPGLAADGSDTFTPRTVIYDLKGAFGTLRRENALYEQQGDAAEQGQWSGATNILRQPAITPSPYQQHLDQGLQPPPLTTTDVRFWSDYNRVFYHPRSIVQLHEYELNSSLIPFERWDTGVEFFSNLDKEHDLLDRDLRPFLEECDQLQGLQVLTSTDDAWGGFAARYLERIRDELGKTSAWVWGLEDGGRKTRERQLLHIANTAQSLYQISPQASMYIPMTTVPATMPSYVAGYQSASRWHTSALQSVALESIMLPSRLRSDEQGRASLDELETVLSNDGKRRIAQLEFSAEDSSAFTGAVNGSGANDSRMNGYTNGLTDTDNDDISKLDIDMTPRMISFDGRRGPAMSGRLFSQVQALRGSWKSSVEIEDVNLAARDRFSQGPRVESHQSSLLFPILDSFPSIFDFHSRPNTLAVQAALSTSASVAQRIRSIERTARQLIGVDQREELCDGLVAIAEEYEEGWESGSDMDEDD